MFNNREQAMKKKISFTGSQGFDLGAQIDTPEKQDPRAFAIFAHCFTCNKNYKSTKNITDTMVEHGFGVFRFDFTGLGESQGDFSNTNFSSNVEDLVEASKFLKENYAPPKLLMGHSLGGAAVLQAAKAIDTIQAVVTIAAPYELNRLSRLLIDEKEIEEKGFITVNIGGSDFRLKKQFFYDLEESYMEVNIEKLNKPLLIFHSPFDKIVGIDQAAKIFQHARHPKSFISLDNADHLLMDENDSNYVGKVAAVWAERYI